MAHIVFFHSILGLRPIEHDLAREWEGDGHRVTLLDLYEGRSAESYEEGFRLYEEVGPEQVSRRAALAVSGSPADSVLAGVSMGAGLVGEAWGRRPKASGAILIAGAAPWADDLRPGFPVQAHIARPDPFDPEEVFTEWSGANPGAALQMHRYDGVGHYFLDPSLSDYDARAASVARAAIRAFLASLAPVVSPA